MIARIEFDAGHGSDLFDLERAAQNNDGPVGDMAREILADRPQLTPYEAYFYRAWLELGSARSFGMAPGPIPFPAIITFAKHYGLSRSQTDILIRVVRNIDNAWINATAEKRARASK